MTHKQSHQWVEALPKLTTSYNKTYHRSIKRTPASVKPSDHVELWKELYESKLQTHKPSTQSFKFKVGDQDCTGKQIKCQQNICDFCGRIYRYKQGLNNHIQAQHMNITYPCSVCGKALKFPGDRIRHEKTICKAEKKLYKCSTCTTECFSLDALKAHSKTHEKQQNNASSRKRKHEESTKDHSDPKMKQQRLGIGVRCRVCAEMFPNRHMHYLHRMNTIINLGPEQPSNHRLGVASHLHLKTINPSLRFMMPTDL